MHVTPAVMLPPLFEDDSVHDTFTTTTVDMPSSMTVRLERPDTPFIDRKQGPRFVTGWDNYVGQQPIKDELRVFIDEVFLTFQPLPHVLLHSGYPGVGKTTLAYLIAEELGVRCATLGPPFSVQAINEAAMSMDEFEVLFIDEFHRMSKPTSEALLTILEAGTVYIGRQAYPLAPFTVIAATTDADKLPETILDRFPIKPFFQCYSLEDMVRITKNFCNYYKTTLSPEVMVAIGGASRATPRAARDLVVGAKALQASFGSGRPVTPQEVLNFVKVEPNGLTRAHKQYLTVLYGRRQRNADGSIAHRAGAETMMSILREGKQGIARIERYLMEQGLLDLTGRGRTLTDLGVAAARHYQEREA